MTMRPGYGKLMLLASALYAGCSMNEGRPMPEPFDKHMPKRDAERMAKAQAKRERKAAIKANRSAT